MRKLAFVIGAVVLLLIGGGLTSQLMSSGGEALLPFITQTNVPDASTLETAPWQAEQLVMFVGFILFNLIGMAATIAIVLWLLHRGVKQARSSETAVTTGGTE
ncbi:MAG: hypothetical protein CL610_11120 [Anaerolineaceae bacterium]|nr:hypothetical protein [Anaerolineaceae bacterium]